MKQKHLTIDDREKIEEMLKSNSNFTDIGNEINKHRTTISKEILNHRFKKEHIQYGTSFANCVDIEICEKGETGICDNAGNGNDATTLDTEITYLPYVTVTLDKNGGYWPTYALTSGWEQELDESGEWTSERYIKKFVRFSFKNWIV